MPNLGLEGFAPFFIYYGGIAILLLTVFWRPILGIYYLTPLIPIQTVRYWVNGYPMGESLVDVAILAIILGALRAKLPLMPKTPLNKVLVFLAVYTYISLWLGAVFLGADAPWWFDNPRLVDWKNFMTMPVLFWLTASIVKTPREMKILFALICLSVFFVDRSFHGTIRGRDMSSFREDLRSGGAMGYVGSNGLAAYEAQMIMVLASVAFFTARKSVKLALYGLAGFSLYCLMYSYSRGGYIAILLGWLFLGLAKKRGLLVALVAFVISWQTLVPSSVQERVLSTYKDDGTLENSANIRVNLWDEAMRMFDGTPLTGVGVFTYFYMGGRFKNPHNYYVQVLVEQGLIGITLWLLILLKFYRLGWALYQRAEEPFLRGLGLGIAGWIVCAAGANFFGDRWTYFQISGQLFVMGGMVAAALAMPREAEEEVEELGPTPDLAPQAA
jgi:O-antigen ligase